MLLFDTGSIVIACIFYLYADNKINNLMIYLYILGTVSTLLFMQFIPESPRHLFMKDSKSSKGIKALNYIAWFNGSNYRVPEDAVMDNTHQVIKENTMLNTTN